MGLITGLVSTVVHVAAGRNPYGHNHNQVGQPTVSTAGYAADPSASCGCTTGRDGEPCGICAVAVPFGKGRQQKRERRAMKHAMKAQRFSNGRYPGYAPAYMAAGAPQYQQQQQQVVAYRGARQEEGVEAGLQWDGRRRAASTGADGDVPPPAYEAAESSRVTARRSVEVLGDGDEKCRQE